MPRLNPLSLQRVSAVTETREFTDPLQPGQTLALTLRVSPDAASRERRKERAGNLLTKYLLGDAPYRQSQGKSGQRPVATPLPKVSGLIGEGSDESAGVFTLPDGGKIVITTRLCFLLASVMDMQEDAATEAHGAAIPADERPYNFIEWATLADRMPSAFEEIISWADDLLNRASGDQQKNSSGVARTETAPTTETSSAPPSDGA